MRAEASGKIKGSLRAIYRMLALPGANPMNDAHAALVLPPCPCFNPERMERRGEMSSPVRQFTLDAPGGLLLASKP